MPVMRITLAVLTAGAVAAVMVGGGQDHASDPARTAAPGFQVGGRDEGPAFTGSVSARPQRSYALAQAEAVPSAPAATPAAVSPDMTALRYFAREGNQRRLEAEVARLKLLYPGWTPPDDLNQPEPVGDPELDRMWQLYAAGKYSEARSAIAARRAADPKWAPPADLAARLNEAEARERLVNASDAKQWETVLSVAAEVPALLTCADADSLWRVGEAFSRTNRIDRARDAYLYLLKNCDDSSVRLATVQKAIDLLDPPRIDELLGLERKGPDGRGEFEAVRADIVRAKVGQAAEKAQPAADADITLLEGLARSGTSAEDPLVLGWYYLRQKVPLKALDWFRLSNSRAESAKATEGLALTLSALGRNQEAEPIAYAARGKAEDNLKAYRIIATALLATDPPPQLDPAVVARAAEELGRAREATGAQAVGWYSYNTNQIATAIQWFSTALRWDPNDEPSAYGLALSLQSRRDRAGFADVVARWRDRSERIAILGDPRRRRAPAAQPVTGLPLSSPPAPAANYTAYSAAPAASPQPVQGVGDAVSRASEAYRTERTQASVYRPEPLQPQPRIEQPRRVDAPVYSEERAPRAVSRPLDDFSEPLPRRAAEAATVASSPRRSSGGGSARGLCPSATSGLSAVNRGWCLMELNRPMEAIQAFDIALQTGQGKVREDAAYGKSLANLRAGLTSEAAMSATEAAQSPRRMVELTAEILTQRALAAYRDDKYEDAIIALDERARYVPEQTDLMVVRGYAYYNLRRYPDADRVFSAVAKTGNAAGLRGLVAIGEVTGRIKD